tara:strand:- start:737 stop:1234 length:498 start_codon:yes stop_codon:yes gene_type:complete
MIELNNKIKKILIKIDSFLKQEKNDGFTTIIKNYNYINEKIIIDKGNYFFINYFIRSYKKKGDLLKAKKNIKKFVKIKNELVLDKIIKSKIYNSFLEEINKKLKKDNINTTKNKISKIYLKILKKNKYNWLGFWSNVVLNKNGSIKNIFLFDINDYIFLKNKLKN